MTFLIFGHNTIRNGLKNSSFSVCHKDGKSPVDTNQGGCLSWEDSGLTVDCETVAYIVTYFWDQAA